MLCRRNLNPRRNGLHGINRAEPHRRPPRKASAGAPTKTNGAASAIAMEGIVEASRGGWALWFIARFLQAVRLRSGGSVSVTRRPYNQSLAGATRR